MSFSGVAYHEESDKNAISTQCMSPYCDHIYRPVDEVSQNAASSECLESILACQEVLK